MLINLKEYSKPESLEQAWKIHRENPKTSIFSTGGLSTSLREDHTTQYLIDLKGLLPDKLVQTSQSYEIGAQMSVNELIASMGNHAIVSCLKRVGTNQIRNMSTLGGSIAQRYGWSDILTALVAYKSELKVFGDKGEKSVSIEDYLASKDRPIVVSIIIDKKHNRGAFQNISRTDYDVSQFNMFMCACVEDDKIKEAGIAYGARPSWAKRLKNAEEAIQGKSLQEVQSDPSALFETVSSANLSNGFGLSEDYRRDLLSVFLKRALGEICQ